MSFVMLVEIPDPEIILTLIAAFVVGLLSLYVYNKAKPFIKKRLEKSDPLQLERLEYYERQLIDMKIRLDALEISIMDEKQPNISRELRKDLGEPPKKHEEQPTHQVIGSPEPNKKYRVPNMDYNNAIDRVLGLITDKSMTSRDIQITLGRTREHTSRLMKKLYQEGFVERKTITKPFTYSISNKGRERLGVLQMTTAVT